MSVRLQRVPVPAWLALAGLLVLAVYWPGLGGGFVFDDYPNIVDNTLLRVDLHSDWNQWLAAIFSSPASDLQRPLAMLTFALNHAATGLDPYWMKLTNLCIHLLNTVLVFGLVGCLLRLADTQPVGIARNQDLPALWVATAWALNPINLMAVLFVVQRMEILSHTFVFAGLWMYLKGRQRLISGRRGWALILAGLGGGTFLGVLSKESAALLPLYALAVEWALLDFAGREANRKDRNLLALFAAFVVLAGIVALAWLVPKTLFAGSYAGRPFTLGERLLTEGRVVVDYLRWTLVPDLGELSLYHDDFPVSHGLLSPVTTMTSLIAIAATLTAMMWVRRRRPLMALGLAWFFAAQLLTATIIPLELVYEHRNYFASLGLCLVLGDALLRMPVSPSSRRIAASTAVLLLTFYTGMTSLRALEWHDVLRFSTTEVAKHPRSPRATYDLARNLIILSNYAADSPYLQPARVALNRAMVVPDASPLPEAAAIVLAARTHQTIPAVWWDSLRAKLRNEPTGPQQTGALVSLTDCAIKFDCVLPLDQMSSTFIAALERSPNAEVLNIYGNYALNALHDPALAARLWEEAARRSPNVVQYQVTLARFYIARGTPELAAGPIERIRRLGRLGQNEKVAAELDQLRATAIANRRLQPIEARRLPAPKMAESDSAIRLGP